MPRIELTFLVAAASVLAITTANAAAFDAAAETLKGEETQCIDWGRLWGKEPVFYKRRR
jgi:hypothetical protein